MEHRYVISIDSEKHSRDQIDVFIRYTASAIADTLKADVTAARINGVSSVNDAGYKNQSKGE